jgi:hypothetical protein
MSETVFKVRNITEDSYCSFFGMMMCGGPPAAVGAL